jgi:hypothetical protein
MYVVHRSRVLLGHARSHSHVRVAAGRHGLHTIFSCAMTRLSTFSLGLRVLQSRAWCFVRSGYPLSPLLLRRVLYSCSNAPGVHTQGGVLLCGRPAQSLGGHRYLQLQLPMMVSPLTCRVTSILEDWPRYRRHRSQILKMGARFSVVNPGVIITSVLLSPGGSARTPRSLWLSS